MRSWAEGCAGAQDDGGSAEEWLAASVRRRVVGAAAGACARREGAHRDGDAHRFGHRPAAIWLGTWHSLAAPLERALFEAGYQVMVLDDAHSTREWNEALIRGLYSAGLIALYTTTAISDEKKNRIYAAVQHDHILDADALHHNGEDSSVVQAILDWIGGLRIGGLGISSTKGDR